MDGLLLHYFNQSLSAPWLDGVMAFGTIAGLAAVPLFALVLLFRPGHHRLGWTILAGLALALALSLGFQSLAGRPRPEEVQLFLPQPAGFFSFPSGHVALVCSFATAVILAWRHLYWSLGVLAWAGLVSLSRVYLGHHWPSDLLGGLFLGVGAGATVYGVLHAGHRFHRIGAWIWTHAGIAATICLMAWLRLIPGWLVAWPYADKVIHFLLVGSLAFWLNLWLHGRRWKGMPIALVVPVVVTLVEEFLQRFSSARSADLADMGCNVAGLLCFWAMSEWVMRGETRPAVLAEEGA